MAANIDPSFHNWSATAASNQPDGTDTADIDAELRQIQSVVRKFFGTKGSDIASATTTNLASATGDYVHITGTTTIEALGTVAVGWKIWLVFDDALTLTHNATSLILPTGANISTAAGDRALCVSLGSGNWRCLSYVRASGAPLALADDSVTYAKLQNVSATSRVLGRKTAAAGDTEELTFSEVLDFVGSAAWGDLMYRGETAWTRLGAGTAGQALKTGGAGAAPSWGTILTAATTQTASGTAVTFESIPAGVKRITVNLAGISTNGTSLKLIQIGDSGGYEDADYTSKAAQMGTSVATATSTAGFVIANDGAAASVLHGSITLSLVEASSNTWAASGNLSRSDTTAMQVCAGSKALSGTLDRIQLTTVNGTDEFDAGSINILYEL